MEKNLKNLFKRYGILIAIVALCIVFCLPVGQVSANTEKGDWGITKIIAEGEESVGDSSGSGGATLEGDTAFALEDSGMDENLYTALIEIYNEVKGIPAGSIEYVTFLRTKMFLEDDINITCLDLSNRNISSLKNFSWMYFKENLVEIRLDNNNIREIEISAGASPFIRVSQNLTSLSMINNRLESIDLAGFTNLVDLNLANNQLNSIDLSGISTVESDVNINLSVNNFTSYDKITFPNDSELTNKLNINLMGNNLPDRTNLFTNINLILALQGVNSDLGTKVTTTDSIYYYKTGLSDLMLVITLDNSNIAPIVLYDSQVEGKINLVELLGVGSFTAYYSQNESTLETLYDEDDALTYAFKPQTFKILPIAPTFKLEYDGELVELSSIEELDRPAVLHLYADDSGAEIYYQMQNSSEWVKAEKVDITRGGKFTISLKTVVKDMAGNEVESEYSYALVQGRLNLYIPTAVLLLIIAAFAILFFAVALPLIKKYVMHN